jgi:DNA-binding NarL/FixJ family response regulator
MVRLLPGLAPAEPDLLVLSESAPATDASTFRALGLTRREAEVLALAGRGLRNRDIARELFISPTTVKKHLENSYRKLGVHSRTAALARAREGRRSPREIR